MKEIANHMVISTKYGFIVLSEIIHNYFNLEGEYIHPIETEIITVNKRNLRMDIAYLRSENIINNIENQSGIVNMEKLEIIAEYAKFLLIHNNSLTNSIIISKVDPKYCQKEIALTKTLFLRPDYIYISPKEINERLNNITYKINNNQELTYDETIELAVLPTLAQDDIAPYITQKICELIKNNTTINETLKTKICFIVEIMIDRNIEDKNTKKELLEMINMEKRKTALEYLIEQENKKSAAKIKELETGYKNLETDNNQLKTDNNQLKTDNNQLNETLQQIKNYYTEKGDIPKEILEILFKI
ncbi:hypothetical protein [Methanobrevibacter sp.]|uniref:hypothetical protein n=1 Tax=Methanobrevibacter sp. TaxID=66852 RepID=UPI0038900D9D